MLLPIMIPWSIVVWRFRCMSGYWCMWHRSVVAFVLSRWRFHLRSLAEGMVQNTGIAPSFFIFDAVLFKVVESLANVVCGSSVYVISSYLGDIGLLKYLQGAFLALHTDWYHLGSNIAHTQSFRLHHCARLHDSAQQGHALPLNFYIDTQYACSTRPISLWLFWFFNLVKWFVHIS